MKSAIIQGDARSIPLADNSVQCCVTSPPYFGLRDYGVSGQIGMELSPAEYVAQMVTVFDEVRRVLRDDGVLWLNLGDSFANDGKWGGHTSGKHAYGLHSMPIGRNKRYTGLKPKDLIGIPWRVAFALQDAGWYLRADIVWSKPNPMPESVTDRPTKAHEYVFLLSKSARYFYDADAVAEDAVTTKLPGRNMTDTRLTYGAQNGGNSGLRDLKAKYHSGNMPTTRNLRSVWNIATQPFSGAHFATMPEELARRCIAAGTSERGCCSACGAPYERIVDRES